MNRPLCDCGTEMEMCGVDKDGYKVFGCKCPSCGKELPIEFPLTHGAFNPTSSTQLELTSSGLTSKEWLMLKNKETILAKLADLLAINFIWDSNQGLPAQHKTEIKTLLEEYYKITGKKQ